MTLTNRINKIGEEQEICVPQKNNSGFIEHLWVNKHNVVLSNEFTGRNGCFILKSFSVLQSQC